MIRKRLCQPLVLAGLLATGFLVVWGVVAMWAVENYLAERGPRGESLLFLPDGTPRLARIDYIHGERQYWDLEGHPVPPAEYGEGEMRIDSQLPAVPPERVNAGETAWEQRIRSFTDGGSPAAYWYFVCEGQPDGTGYFVGYDSKSRACIGFLGTAGFRTGTLPSEELIPFGGATGWGKPGVVSMQAHGLPTRYPDPGWAGMRPRRGSLSSWDVYVLGRGGRIYHADLQKRTVNVILEEPRLCSIAVVPGVRDPVQGTPERLVARTAERLLVLDEHGQLLKRYPIPEPLRDRELHFAETTTGEGLMYWNSPADTLATQVDYRVYWVSTDGPYREKAVTLPSGEMQELRVLSAVMAPAPLVLGGALAIYRPQELFDNGLESSYPAALGRTLAEFWPALLITQLLAVGLAVLCYRRQVRYQASASERVLWPLFVLGLGLPGWVAYRFGQAWPMLETCPACGVGVPRDREECVCCEADFPRPALKGTEVFA